MVRKISKIVAALCGIIGFCMMFLTQVVIDYSKTGKVSVGLAALVGGDVNFVEGKTTVFGAGSGLGGYICLAAAGLIFLACALLAFFKEHEVMNYIALGAAIIAAIVGIILVFTLRASFVNANGEDNVTLGFGAIIGGVLGSVSILAGLIGLIGDVAN